MAYPSVTYVFVNATTASASEVNQNFTDLVNGISDGTKDLNVNALTAAGTATFNGAVNLGNATGDDVTVTGYIASALIPKTDNTHDLGTAALAWQDGYFDGSVYTDSILELTAANGIVIDGVKCKDNNIEATTSGGIVILDDGGVSCVDCNDGGAVTIGPDSGLDVSHIIQNSKATTGYVVTIKNNADTARVSIDSTGTNKNTAFNMTPTGSGAGFFTLTTGTGGFYWSTASTSSCINITDAGALLAGPTSGLTSYHILRNSSTTNGDPVVVVRKNVAINTSGNYYAFFQGSSSADDGYLLVSGTTFQTGDASDGRKKENIRSKCYGLNEVLALKPVLFDWKEEHGGIKDVKGFIAQDVESVLPECVSTLDESARGGFPDAKVLGMTSMIPVLVAAIQDLSAKLDEANARIAALEAR